MANEIYLSPRKILEHLCVLEEKVPRKFNTPYIPTGEILVGESALDLEAKKMLDYVGLGHYSPICRFTELEKGTAGCIEMGGSGYVANIKIDKQYQGNTTIILAILAHEVCHKLIYLHGIDFPNMQIVNEVYTDLCTLYIGFGDLIIKGYKTISHESDTTTTHMLGYLKYDMYIDSYEIVKCVYGGYAFISNGHNDILLQECLEKYTQATDKKSLIIEKFKNKECKFAELHRDILILEQVLNRCYIHNRDDIKRYNDIAINSGLFDKLNTSQNKIKVLKSLYDLEVEQERKSMIESCIKSIERNFITLGAYCHNSDRDINYGVIKCPCCGYMAKENIKSENISIIKCHKCGVMFVKNSTEIDLCEWNQQSNDFISEEKKQKKQLDEIKEKQTKLYNDMILFNQEKHEFSSYKISIEEQAEQRVQKIKSEILQEGRLQMWNDMPAILKWLTKKYITKKD